MRKGSSGKVPELNPRIANVSVLLSSLGDLFQSSSCKHPLGHGTLGNGQNALSQRELTEFLGKLGEFRERLGECALAHK